MRVSIGGRYALLVFVGADVNGGSPGTGIPVEVVEYVSMGRTGIDGRR